MTILEMRFWFETVLYNILLSVLSVKRRKKRKYETRR
jgi:hypothetical protein